MDFDYENIPIGYYDKVLTEGLKKKRGLQSSWHNLKFCTVKENLYEYDSHLDIACGPGTFIGNYLDNRSFGIDISNKQIDYAKKTYLELKDNFMVSDIRYEAVDKNDFDVITVLELIEHFQPNEVNELVNLLMSKLGENGKLILTTPNYSGIWLFLEKIVSIVGPVNYKYQHINRYTKNRILKQFTEYRVEVKKYINFGIFFSIFSTDLGIFMNKLISKIFFNFFGYSLIITIYKSKK